MPARTVTRGTGGAPLAALALAAALAGGALVAPESARGDGGAEALRVLFVGNSYTRYHGLPGMVEALADADPAVPRLKADLVFLPGAGLDRHWRLRRAIGYLRDHHYTHVVLQGHSLDPIERPRELARYIQRFHRVAEQSGARTVLYATWARHPDNPLYQRGTVGESPAEMQARIDHVYGRIARSVDATLAPVGRAWGQALDAVPTLRLHGEDGSHPTRHGSYLAACVLYGAITGRSPTEAGHRPAWLSPAEAARLQAVAAAALREPAEDHEPDQESQDTTDAVTP